MKKRFAAALVCSVASSASGALLLYEPFDYGDAPAPLSGHVDTYVTPNQAWYKGGTTNEPKVNSGNLSYAGLPPSVGNSALIGGTGTTSNTSLSRIQIGTDLKAAYYSMIVKVPSTV